MAKLKAIIDKLEDVDEALRGFYSPGIDDYDGKFVLDVESSGGLSLEDVSGLKSALGAERSAKESAERKLKDFEGLDPKKARDALAKIKEIGDFDPEKEADKIAAERFKTRETQLIEKHETELAEKEQAVVALNKQLEQVLIDAEASKELSKQGGSVDLLLPHIQRSTRLKKDTDGNYVVEVIDVKGNPRIGDSKGGAMTIGQLVEEMKQSDVFGRAFDANGSSGTGGAGGSNTTRNGSQDGTNPWSKAGWNLTRQGQIVREKGSDTAKRMAESVGSSLGAIAPPA